MEEMPAHGTAGFISWLAATDLAVTISSVQASDSSACWVLMSGASMEGGPESRLSGVGL